MLPRPGSMAAVLQSAWINTFARSYSTGQAPRLPKVTQQLQAMGYGVTANIEVLRS